MTKPITLALSAAVVATALSGAAQAQDIYGVGILGLNNQANPSEPYGNNIAVDPDFPGEFDFDSGTTIGLGLGYRISNTMRIEGRLMSHQSDFNDRHVGTGARAGEEYILDGSLSSVTLTVEGFYDIPTQSAVQPYVKAGLGMARNSYDARLGGAGVAAFDAFDGATDGFYDAYSDGKSSEFTWNIGAGASYALGNGAVLFGEYQYVSLGSVQTGQDSFTDGFGVDADVHEVLIGVRMNF